MPAGDGEKARAFCNSPAFQDLQCGWASQEERSATTGSQCPFCGTTWSGASGATWKLPIELSAGASYYQRAGQVISLACNGLVLVRAVMQALDTKNGTGCMRLFKDGNSTTAITRCELAWPEGVQPAAATVASAREVNCQQCEWCSECSLVEAGKWYSWTYTTNVGGCPALSESGTYMANRPAVSFDPGTKGLLAQFEVQQA